MSGTREGSLGAPTRHALDWKSAAFYDEDALTSELERVYDICHGCRRCVSLCNAFPTLFDLVDESSTMEVDGVDKKDYWKVVDQCYLCDLCFLTKCPYVPPHEWNVDFPHLMLQAKAVKFKQQGASSRDKFLSSTDRVGSLAGIPIVVNAVNAANKNAAVRSIMDNSFGISKDAVVPEYHSNTLRKQLADHLNTPANGEAAGRTQGQVALFTTCYCNYNAPDIGMDMVRVLEHNDIPVRLADKEKCCGMPKLELGDLEAVEALKNANIPVLAKLVDEGWDIISPIPSCVLMFKQELPLLFPDDEAVIKVRDAMFDPFEYLMLRHKEGKLKTDFKQSLGKVSYQVACHQRVQKIGMKTRDALKLVPDTEVEAIERCSGHDGTYAVKKEFHEFANKICRPVVNRIKKAEPDHYTSDCVMAGEHIAKNMGGDKDPEHPVTLLRIAYGL
ncbi:MAG: Fe-S oxidoreductase [gamma proteobacterium symbiont of Bathyaustriella thionipta]|nr:Fe-S oxidoreductase [gamma proteobacterium symbiont of Bathyaustriella thionipta]